LLSHPSFSFYNPSRRFNKFRIRGGSTNSESEVGVSEQEREFSISATPINHSGRVGPMMSYDSESDRTIIFGGYDYDGSNPLSDQTWAYDLNTDSYSNMSPSVAPPPLEAGRMTYDSQSDRSIMFGGLLNPSGLVASGSTWAYDYNANTWTNQSPSVAPDARIAPFVTYDSQSDRVILFGGLTFNPAQVIFNDTWSYSFDTNLWEEMNPSSAPGARFGSAMTYDIESDRVILFGGNSDITTVTPLSDTWAYDFETDRWTELSTTTPPAARYTSPLMYDSESDRAVLIGGYPLTSGGDITWLFDYNTNNWTQASPDPHPSARFRHLGVYDSESDSIIIFGGMTGAWNSEQVINTDTTWKYDVNTDTWTKMAEVIIPPTTTTPTTTEPPAIPAAALVAVVIITGLTLAVVIIVLVVKGVIFPKIEGVPGD